ARCSQPSHGAGLLYFPHLVCIGKWEVGDSGLNLLKNLCSPTWFPLYPPVSFLLYCLMNWGRYSPRQYESTHQFPACRASG
ncbi:hypothetical protein DVQ25_14290, partial [Yersinia enterocolitica]|nr:hypothetical protein [Yersinia enterocolitica]